MQFMRMLTEAREVHTTAGVLYETKIDALAIDTRQCHSPPLWFIFVDHKDFEN